MAISVDAQILIWGIKRQATANRQHMIERAAAFFRQCDQNRTQIYIPAQSLAEFLCDYDADKRRQSLAKVARGFQIAPFDGKAAVIAAELMADWNQLRQIGDENGLTKQQIKADINVLASALAVNARYLYSEDRQMISFAKGRNIIIEKLPTSTVPPPADRKQETQRTLLDHPDA